MKIKIPSIAPSILSADFACLEKDIRSVEKAGAKILHLDVMDGHFVPNISFGDCVVRAVRKITSMELDVHLMISNPYEYVERFADAGSDYITFHIEARGLSGKNEIAKTVRKIRSLGKKPGISIKPATPVKSLYPFAGSVDLILIMTVEPGFGGQKIINSALEKIGQIKEYINARGMKCMLSVDGGINSATIREAAGLGAGLLVCGSSVFGKANPGDEFKKLSKLIDISG